MLITTLPRCSCNWNFGVDLSLTDELIQVDLAATDDAISNWISFEGKEFGEGKKASPWMNASVSRVTKRISDESHGGNLNFDQLWNSNDLTAVLHCGRDCVCACGEPRDWSLFDKSLWLRREFAVFRWVLGAGRMCSRSGCVWWKSWGCFGKSWKSTEWHCGEWTKKTINVSMQKCSDSNYWFLSVFFFFIDFYRSKAFQRYEGKGSWNCLV